jgi:gluconate 2-dehydrogenase gamma chain
MKRREFVAAGLLITVHEASATGWQTFRDREAALVEALSDRIIPADDDPGAKEAGVVHYIDRQLAGPLRRHAAAYRNGIAAFAKNCRDRTGRGFGDLSDEEKDEFLRQIESGAAPGGAFFQMVIDHTMQGFYGSPRHGGNRGESSWKMLGIENAMREEHDHGSVR